MMLRDCITVLAFCLCGTGSALADACADGSLQVAQDDLSKVSGMIDRSKADLPSSLLESAGKPTYTKWFGAYSDARVALVLGTLEKTKGAVSNVTFECWKDTEFFCVLPAKPEAFVGKDKPYKVNLCERYFAQTKQSERSALLIHEISHFNVVAATTDEKTDKQGALDLAIVDSDAATKNAANYQGYAINYF
jgi:hypothetical protein